MERTRRHNNNIIIITYTVNIRSTVSTIKYPEGFSWSVLQQGQVLLVNTFVHIILLYIIQSNAAQT